jgi:hypothetical protein
MSDATDDPVPRDVIALVVLHALLLGHRVNRVFNDDVIASYANKAFKFADAMKQRAGNE